MKNIRFFYLKMFSFFRVKFSIYLNRRIFIMWCREIMSVGQNNQCRQRLDLRKLVGFYPVGVPISLITYSHLFGWKTWQLGKASSVDSDHT